ncbi:MAG: TetR/AcrR family transcriptional regulator [Chloroflexi bacterium]|nr:TetR/AcrR family transcriptional regulator [Chloroflexota bacterium]
MTKTISPKNQLLETAARLFFPNGYRAIGVDTISAESGIGKMTLYRHFESKDDLIVAYLQDSNAKFWKEFEKATHDASSPREKLVAFFQALSHYAADPNCYGCPFLNVATEYPDLDYPGHKVALEHKQTVRQRFRDLAVEAGARDPNMLADQLFLLMDGAYMAARMFGTKNPASHVASAAKTLIDAQMSE